MQLLLEDTERVEVVLRPYQQEAVDATLEAFGRHRSALIVMPTGTGKTIVLASIIARMRGRVLVLAHREELLAQLRATIRQVTGRAVSLDRAEDYGARYGVDDVVVASVQTQISRYGDLRRYERWDARDFALVIIDEAHHAVAPSYRRVIDHMIRDGDARVLGVTATPDRADEVALGSIFQTVAYEYDIVDAIDDGWLVPIRQTRISVEGLDYSHVRTTAGDLNQGDLAAILEEDAIVDRIAAPTVELADDRRTIIFCVSVAQALHLTDVLNTYRADSARCVHGGTPAVERELVIEAFRSGRAQYLVNVGVATEGFDVPEIGLVVCARPTKSRPLYAQMIGRGTRPLPGTVDGLETADQRKQAIRESAKPNVEVLDFTGNSGRHKLVTCFDILGGRYDAELVAHVERSTRRVTVDVSAELRKAALEEAEKRRAEVEKKRNKRHQARRAVNISARYVTHEVDPFDWLNIVPVRERAWHRGRSITPAMRNMLLRYNVQIDRLNYTTAQQVIREIIRRDLPTAKQVKLLRKYGLKTDGVTFRQASSMIQAIADNGWRVPKCLSSGSLPPPKTPQPQATT